MLAMSSLSTRGVRLPASSLTTIVGAPPGACSLLQRLCSHLHQKWKLVLNKAVRPAAWLAKCVENALS
jgi:hypothetical protein